MTRTRRRAARRCATLSATCNALKDAGAEDVIVRGRDEIAIVPESVDCDYYRFLDGDPDAVNLYRGEYMSQYSWVEMTAGSLSRE